MYDHTGMGRRLRRLILLFLVFAVLILPIDAKMENVTLGSYVVSFDLDESVIGNYEIIVDDPLKENVIPSPDSEYSYLLTSYALDIINDTARGYINIQERHDVPGPINWTHLLMEHSRLVSKLENTIAIPGTAKIGNSSSDICILGDKNANILYIIAIYPLSNDEPQICSMITVPPEWIGSIYKTIRFEKINSTDDESMMDLYSVLPNEYPGPDDPGYLVFPSSGYCYLLYWTGTIYRYPLAEAFETFSSSPDDPAPDSRYRIEFNTVPKTIQYQMIKDAQWKWNMTKSDRRTAMQNSLNE